MDAETNPQFKKVSRDSGQSYDLARTQTKPERIWETRFVWLLMFAIAALAAYHFLYSRVDNAIRDRVIGLLSKRYPQHVIALDSAHLEHGRGLVLEGLHIALPTERGPRIVARVPRMILRGPMNLVGLAQGVIPIDRIYVDSIDVSVWQLPDGSWSLQTLSSQDPLPASIPPVEIRKGLLRLSSRGRDSNKEIICHDLNISLQSIKSPASLPPLTVKTSADVPLSLTTATKEFQDGVFVSMKLGSSYFDDLNLSIGMSRDKKQWTMLGHVNRLNYSPQLVERLPEAWTAHLEHLAGFSGFGTADFAVRQTREEAKPFFEIHTQVQDGRLQHPKLPYPLEELAGVLYCRNDLLQLRQATARSGRATFRVESDMYGLSIGVPMVVKLNATQLPLDDRLYSALPVDLQEQWRKLKVAGEVDANVSLSFDGARWSQNLDLVARGVAIELEIFPYPISDIQGEFHYRDGILTAPALTGLAHGQVVRSTVRLERANPKWLIDMMVQTDGPVPIDDTLISALTPQDQRTSSTENFVRSLNPSGTVHLEKSRFVRDAKNPDVLTRSIEMAFYGGAIRYAEFHYPIFDIQGHVSIQDSKVSLSRIRGRNDSARIFCEGECICADGLVNSLHLDFDAANVPLEEELQSAMPSSVRSLWDHLRPSGVIDRVLITLDRQMPRNQVELSVLIQEDGKVDPVAGRCVTMQPKSLPYLLNDVSCDLSYRPGVVEIRRFGASHDSSQVRAEGDCRVRSDGTWSGLLTWLPTTRLTVDQSLLVSLPSYLRMPLLSTEFRGPLGITGKTLIASNAQSGEPTIKAWDLQIEVEDGQLAGGSLASGLRGTLLVQGENQETGPIAKGFMEIDSVAIKNIPLTKLVGPFAVTDSKLVVGRLASEVQIAPLSDYIAVHFPDTPQDGRGVVLASAMNGQVPSTDAVPNRYVVENLNAGFRNSSEQSKGSIASYDYQKSPQAAPNNNAMHRSGPQNGGQPSFWKTASAPTLDVDPQDLHARALSGTVHIYGTHPLIEGQTELSFALEDADLAGCLADLAESHTSERGRLWGQCRLAGSLMHANTLGGSGNVWLRDANLFAMPAMLRLFRVLSVKPPDEGAFESADIAFRIDGDRIPIDRISLDGDVLSLRGSGSTTIRRDLHLDLYAYVGRRSALAAVFGPLVSQNDNATMLQVEVTGTTDNPQFRRSFPLMGNTLQQVFPERVR